MDAHVPELPRFIHLANLSTEKLHQLETTLAFILDSPNAQDTYAQIIDGKATWQSHVDPNTCGFSTEKTIVSDHPKPSDGGLQLYREVRAILTPQTLKVELQVCLSSIPSAFCPDADSDIGGPELPKCSTREP